MGNKIAVATEVCGDLPPLIDTSLDCSLCTIGFPQYGGRIGISFHTGNFCPTTAVEPAPSIWLNGMYTQFGRLLCRQPGEDAEPDPGLFVANGNFSSIGYTNPLTGRGSSHKFRFTAEVRPTSKYTVMVKWVCQVLGPKSVWQPYSSLDFEMVEVLGPNDSKSLPYRSRQFVATSGTTYHQWKGETRAYPPAQNPAKGDIYTTQWSLLAVPPIQNLPDPFPPNTPAGWAFMWNGTKWVSGGNISRWDIEKIRADNGQPITLSRYLGIDTDSSIAGQGDGITSIKATMGLESMREGCGGGGNGFPVCGMWFPIKDDSHPGAWHTCFRVIIEPDDGLPWFTTIGADAPDCGKKFLVSDGTIQYGPFCGCDSVEMKPHGKWESQKNDDIPCYYPEVVTIGVPGEDTATVQEIQTNGTGSIVIKQLDGGKIWACHGIATGEDPASPNKCSLMDWEFVEVAIDKVVATGSPYVYKLRFENHKLTMWLHSLRFPSDPIMPEACGPVEPAPWRWYCVNQQSVASDTPPAGATAGPFDTLEECMAVCEPKPQKKWYCVNGACGEYDYKPTGATSGPHDSQADCAANCQPPPPVSKWYCVDGVCARYETAPTNATSGPHDTEAQCNADCSIPQSPIVYVCTIDRGCIQMDRTWADDHGVGYWETESDCLQACNTPTDPDPDPPDPPNPYAGQYCVPVTNPTPEMPGPYGCISWGGTNGPPSGAVSGPYTSLDACVQACSSPVEASHWCVQSDDIAVRRCVQSMIAPPATISGPYPTSVACFENCGTVVDPTPTASSVRSMPVGQSLRSINLQKPSPIMERIRLPCVNLGEFKEKRKMECRCGYIDVYACKKHGECTRIVEGFKSMPVCSTCPDYTTPE